jgi:GAF domain-containing protein
MRADWVPGDVMEPIPETSALFDEFGMFYDEDLLAELKRSAEAVRELVPDLVGVSLASIADGAAFTLVASDSDVAVLDAIQYIAGGPCAEAPQAEQVLEYDADEPVDEKNWQRFASATAAKAVATTLTLPVLGEGEVIGSVNLYAASSRAFAGLHKDIARIFGAWAPGAITNADLSFHTRQSAEQAPGLLRATMHVEMAVGVLMEAESVDADMARTLLDEAAQRAGVPSAEVAEALLLAFQSPKEN